MSADLKALAEAVLATCVVSEARASEARGWQKTAVWRLQADADQARQSCAWRCAARAGRRDGSHVVGSVSLSVGQLVADKQLRRRGSRWR
jgi:hypothetical protein